MREVVTKDSLNHIASKYHLNTKITDKDFDKHFHQLCFEWARSFFTISPNILEMGYGEGNLTKELLDEGCNVDIVEGAELLTIQAKERFGSSINIYHSLFSEFIPPRNYDFILATNILEHVDNPSETLKNIGNWCSSSTKVILTVPNSDSIHRRLSVIMGIQESNDTLSPRDYIVGHQRVYSYEKLIAEVNLAGFDVIAQKGFLLKILPNSMMKDMSKDLVEAFYKIADQIDIRYTADIGILLEKRDQGK